jgi:ribosomal-protein-alanine N-acetyltransferase
MQFELLETERLHLRKVTPAEYTYVFDTYDDNALQHFFGHATTDDVKKEGERFRKGLTTFNKTFLLFQLLDKTTGRNIGWCGYHTWYTDHSRAEMGYALSDESLRNRGFMREAMAAIIRYGFEVMQLNRIEAFISPLNVPSLQLVKGFHFTQEGHLRQHYFKNNVHEDSLVFALLRHEYQSENK